MSETLIFGILVGCWHYNKCYYYKIWRTCLVTPFKPTITNYFFRVLTPPLKPYFFHAPFPSNPTTPHPPDKKWQDLQIFTVQFKPRSAFWLMNDVGVFSSSFKLAGRCVAALQALFDFTSRWQQTSSSFFLLCWQSKVLIQVRKAISSPLLLRRSFAMHLYVVFWQKGCCLLMFILSWGSTSILLATFQVCYS